MDQLVRLPLKLVRQDIIASLFALHMHSHSTTRCFDSSRLLWCATVCAILLATGCTGSNPDGLVPVSGKVLLDGEPLPHGALYTVMDSGKGAEGEIGPDGTFELTTRGKGRGATAGTHTFAIVAYELPPSELSAEHNAKLIIPRMYTQTATSGLTRNFKAGQQNEITLKLDSKGK